MVFVPKTSFAWRAYRRLVRTHIDFFSAETPLPKADILKLYGLSAPFPDAENQSCPTIVIDLSPPEDALWNGVDAKSRKVIRQAGREGITVDHLREVSEEEWNRFQAAYNKLRSRKSATDALGVGQIGELMARGMLVMSVCRDAEGNCLSWHTYVCHNGHVRLLNTVSAIDPARDTQWNNMVGRAHRLHHWKDMLFFKQEGAQTYDLGGVYRGSEDKEQLNIARFKSSFGGEPSETYSAVLPLSSKGRFALSLLAKIGAEARVGDPSAGSRER